MPDYIITITVPANGEPHTSERLVRAKNEAAALKHVVADTITVDRADTDDVIRLSKAGVELEKAE